MNEDLQKSHNSGIYEMKLLLNGNKISIESH